MLPAVAQDVFEEQCSIMGIREQAGNGRGGSSSDGSIAGAPGAQAASSAYRGLSRPGQEGVVEAILGRRDALAVMPTGAGKSVCYQVPGVVMDGLALVV